ncbi:hypothetical protein [Bradyrhizobium sp. CB2312]|uniref:hypothetical protein n=1 Tax=Bradyrhizobium sp. CB2312 TaxID=3039155 RepID=UPI0024B0EBB4|nr:hypothetical protein [Bradyrhizobium sp. CB2312]WFU71445.1 hypothetical protein QA642_40755 [Bradyrhizobium sp. CB2312]
MPRNRGKKARDKRDFVTKELTLEERNAMLDAILTPPVAISYALIGALAVEHELELSIKARLRRISQNEWEAILSDKDGPLGTFDRKIKFANYLGILDSSMRANLDVIRNIRNKFAHTKRLMDFDHPFIADELIKLSAPKGQKRNFAKSSKYPPQWRYVSLCLHALRLMSKKRHGNRSAAFKAWSKRQEKRNKQSFGLLGGLFASSAPSGSFPAPPPPPSLLTPTPPLQMKKTEFDPSNPTPYGLLSGLLPYLEDKKGKT